MSEESSDEDSGPIEGEELAYGVGEEPGSASEDEAGPAETSQAARGRGRGGARGARGGAASKPPGKNDAAWSRLPIELDIPAFTAPTGIIPPPDPPEHPIDCFITTAILEMFRIQTNCRAHSELAQVSHKKILDDWKDVSVGEMHAFIAIVVTMGINELPDVLDYWSTDSYYHNSFVSSLMPRDRFKQIKHCLMVANPTPQENTDDRLAKVRPLLDLVNKISRDRFNPHQDLSLETCCGTVCCTRARYDPTQAHTGARTACAPPLG